MQVQDQSYARLCRTQVRASATQDWGQHSIAIYVHKQYSVPHVLGYIRLQSRQQKKRKAWESPRFNSLSYHHHLRVVGLIVCSKLSSILKSFKALVKRSQPQQVRRVSQSQVQVIRSQIVGIDSFPTMYMRFPHKDINFLMKIQVSPSFPTKYKKFISEHHGSHTNTRSLLVVNMVHIHSS